MLGKHSNAVFAENTNSENSQENSLLDKTLCLTGQIIHDLHLSAADNSINTNETLAITTTNKIQMNKSDLNDLLNQFEVNISYWNVLNVGITK